MPTILVLSGLALYLLNYAIGWLLFFRRISVSKMTHQLFFALIIINIFVLILFVPCSLYGVSFLVISLVTMLILPLGLKGGYYHRTVSTIGFATYLAHLFLR